MLCVLYRVPDRVSAECVLGRLNALEEAMVGEICKGGLVARMEKLERQVLCETSGRGCMPTRLQALEMVLRSSNSAKQSSLKGPLSFLLKGQSIVQSVVRRSDSCASRASGDSGEHGDRGGIGEVGAVDGEIKVLQMSAVDPPAETLTTEVADRTEGEGPLSPSQLERRVAAVELVVNGEVASRGGIRGNGGAESRGGFGTSDTADTAAGKDGNAKGGRQVELDGQLVVHPEAIGVANGRVQLGPLHGLLPRINRLEMATFSSIQQGGMLVRVAELEKAVLGGRYL